MTQHEQHPSLKAARGRTLPALEHVRVRAVAVAPLLDVTAEQHYINASRKSLEVVYTFPVPPRAVLLGLEFVLGDRTLSGVVQSKQAADQSYDAAIEAGDTAVLVEAQRDGLYTANLGNLQPGERALIRIRYGQLLEAQGDDWRIAIPTVLAPFYGDAELDGGLDARATPMQSLAVDYPLELALELPDSADPTSLRCTSHAASIEAKGGALVARLPADARLDRDVVFLARRPPSGGAVAGRDGERAVVVASTVLREADVADRPASVRIVLDCSGSMAGDSMDWAAVGCQRLVEGLRDGDEFSITRFGSSVDHWTPRMLSVGAGNHGVFARRLLEVVADLGGTEMEQALRGAAELPGTQERSDIVLVTDGEIWASDALVRWARSAGLRVSVVGVGAAPNQPFLTRLAEATGGSCEFVTPGEDMILAIGRVLAVLRQPRSEALAVDWPTRPDWSLQLPAVAHAGQAVHLVAGFEAAPIGEVAVAGCTIALPGRELADDALARVIAYQRLLSGHFAEPARAAEQYQLVTEWTSLVAVAERAPQDKARGLPRIAKVEHMLAAGWGGTGTAPAVWRSVSSAVASACAAPPVHAAGLPIPAFLRKAASPRGRGAAKGGHVGESRRPANESIPVRTEERKRAARQRSAELSGWIRAINRRIVVETLSGSAATPTLRWLAGCVPPALIERLGQEVHGGTGERSLVCAFIRELGALAPDLEESLSERTVRWLDLQKRSDAGLDDGPAVTALRVLDDLLFAEHWPDVCAVYPAGVCL